jgi:hypothetical protein
MQMKHVILGLAAASLAAGVADRAGTIPVAPATATPIAAALNSRRRS